MEKKPFHAVTITDIAQRAGVSRLTFYRNFKSKEAILRQYYDDEFNRFLAGPFQRKKAPKQRQRRF